MSLSLHTMQPSRGYRRSKKRVGRGNSSGHGTYSGRGRKGQRSRSGGSSGLKTRAVRQTLVMRLPKNRGFKSSIPDMEIVNIGALVAFANGALVTPEALLKLRLIRNTNKGVKILGKGVLKVPLTLKDCFVSASAKAKIEKAGGTVTLPVKK